MPGRRAGKQPVIHGPFSTEPPGGSAAAGVSAEGVTGSSTCHRDVGMALNSCLLETTLLVSSSAVESQEHHRLQPRTPAPAAMRPFHRVLSALGPLSADKG